MSLEAYGFGRQEAKTWLEPFTRTHKLSENPFIPGTSICPYLDY